MVVTPEQNGVAEGANDTSLETTRALRNVCGLDNRYWAEALEMTVYLKNICPTISVKGMVLFHACPCIKPIKNLVKRVLEFFGEK